MAELHSDKNPLGHPLKYLVVRCAHSIDPLCSFRSLCLVVSLSLCLVVCVSLHSVRGEFLGVVLFASETDRRGIVLNGTLN